MHPGILKVWQSQTGLQIGRKMLCSYSNILIGLKIAEFRMPTPQDVRKQGSEILKLPPIHNCVTLTMTNKLVVIINSLKYQKLRKFYYMKWNFFTKLQLPPEPLTSGLPPPDPRSLCLLSSTELVEPPLRTKFLGTPLLLVGRLRISCILS